jgi:hypothetical protein
MKRISNNISLCVILSIYSMPSIFVRARPMIFARLIEYLKFSSRNPLKLNEKYFRIRRKKPKYLNTRPRLKLSVFIRNRICLIKKTKNNFY